MDTTDHAEWHRQINRRLQEQQRLRRQDDEAQITVMNDDEHLVSFEQEETEFMPGRSNQTEIQQPRRPMSTANNMFGSLHTRPTRQALERADAIEEDMDARQTLRRAGRHNNRARGWPMVRFGNGQARLR